MNKEYSSPITEKETGYSFRQTAKALAAATLRFGSLAIGPGDDISAAVVAAVHHDSQSEAEVAILSRSVTDRSGSSKESIIKLQGDETTEVVIWKNSIVPQGTERIEEIK